MTKERIPPKKFHLNRYQYHGIEAWVPPPTRDKHVAAERRKYPKTLVHSQQALALHAMARFASYDFESASDQRYADYIVARGNISAASFQLENTTMYSITNLAHIAEGSSKKGDIEYQTNEGLRAKYRQQLAYAAEMADLHLVSTRANDHALAERRGRVLGKYMANSSLTAAVLDMPDQVRGQDPFDIQMEVRERTMQFVEEVGEYAKDIGVLPSIAQLVEPDSPFAVDIRRHAPTPVLRVYESAFQDLPEQIAA